MLSYYLMQWSPIETLEQLIAHKNMGLVKWEESTNALSTKFYQ